MSLNVDIVTGYINAGGRGTRLNGVFAPDPRIGITKALLEVGDPGIRLIDHQINRLLHAGLTRIVAGVGDHSHVEGYIRDTRGSSSHIRAVVMAAQLGNGGDLVQAVRRHPDWFGPQILVGNVDTILDYSECGLIGQHQKCGAELTIALTRNSGVPNENAYAVGSGGEVVFCGEIVEGISDFAEVASRVVYRASSTGALVVNTELLRNMPWVPADGPLSLYRDIVAAAMSKEAAFAYDNGRGLFIDVGTASTWEHTQRTNLLQPYLCYSPENKETK